MENKKKGELTRVKFYTDTNTNKVKNEKKKEIEKKIKTKIKPRGVIKCKCLHSY